MERNELAQSLNVLLLIQSGCAEEPAKRFAKQFEEKCEEVRDLRIDNARLRDELFMLRAAVQRDIDLEDAALSEQDRARA